mmetsp:Transcript_5932/g.12412  ORF Transcript_5932/g.12412 Transcript_5932/m.12412 type:complete len:268 (-) Transcript_5932:282-1085(-)
MSCITVCALGSRVCVLSRASSASLARSTSPGRTDATRSSIFCWDTGGSTWTPMRSRSRFFFIKLSWRAHTSVRASAWSPRDSNMRMRFVRAFSWEGSSSRRASQSEMASSISPARSYMAERLLSSVIACFSRLPISWQMSRASVNLAAASRNFLLLNRALASLSAASSSAWRSFLLDFSDFSEESTSASAAASSPFTSPVAVPSGASATTGSAVFGGAAAGAGAGAGAAAGGGSASFAAPPSSGPPSPGIGMPRPLLFGRAGPGREK